jgi:hypothetical protein
MAGCLPRSSPQTAIRFGGGFLCGASGLASNLAEPGCHPPLGAEKTFQETWHVEIGIKFGKVNSETGRTDLDFGKLRRLGMFEALGIVR